MVSWQTWVSIGFETAEAKGAQFSGISDGASFMSDLAAVWQSDKQRYRQMTKQQVRDLMEDLVSA